jgi:hypothetical protein
MDTRAVLERVESAIIHFLALEKPVALRLIHAERQKEQIG